MGSISLSKRYIHGQFKAHIYGHFDTSIYIYSIIVHTLKSFFKSIDRRENDMLNKVQMLESLVIYFCVIKRDVFRI